jgi:hypothetical protein
VMLVVTLRATKVAEKVGAPSDQVGGTRVMSAGKALLKPKEIVRVTEPSLSSHARPIA